MRNGDISNHTAPRVAIVFEGALGFLETRDEVGFHKLMDKHRYADAVSLFKLNDLLVRVIWDRVWRLDMNIDIVTFLGPDAWAQAVAERLGNEELPVGEVWATTPQILARKLLMMPDLIRVYTPFAEHQLLFGGAGRYFTDVNQLGQ